jgi:hypothetical protein
MTGQEPAQDPGQARRLAVESLANNDPTGWFERVYAAGTEGEAALPWDRSRPFRMLVDTSTPADQGPPWPLTRREIESFGMGGLTPVRIEDLPDPDDPPGAPLAS